MTQPIYLSQEGLDKLRAELEHLRTVRRHDVAESIQQSRERGGTVSNAEYEEAKNELAFTEGRILTLDNLIHNAVIIEKPLEARETVEVGATVTVQTQDGKPSNTQSQEARSRSFPRKKSPTFHPLAKACWESDLTRSLKLTLHRAKSDSKLLLSSEYLFRDSVSKSPVLVARRHEVCFILPSYRVGRESCPMEMGLKNGRPRR